MKNKFIYLYLLAFSVFKGMEKSRTSIQQQSSYQSLNELDFIKLTADEQLQLNESMEKSLLMTFNPQKFEILQWVERFSIKSLPKENLYDHRQYIDKIIPEIPDFIYFYIVQLIDLIIEDYNNLRKQLPLCIKVLINTIYNDQTLKKYLDLNPLSQDISFKEEYKKCNEELLGENVKSELLTDFKTKLFYFINMCLMNNQEILLSYFHYKIQSSNYQLKKNEVHIIQRLIAKTVESTDDFQKIYESYMQPVEKLLTEIHQDINKQIYINKHIFNSTNQMNTNFKNQCLMKYSETQYQSLLPINGFNGWIYTFQKHNFKICYFLLLTYNPENKKFTLHKEMVRDNLSIPLVFSYLIPKYCGLHTFQIFNPEYIGELMVEEDFLNFFNSLISTSSKNIFNMVVDLQKDAEANLKQIELYINQLKQPHFQDEFQHLKHSMITFISKLHYKKKNEDSGKNDFVGFNSGYNPEFLFNLFKINRKNIAVHGIISELYKQLFSDENNLLYDGLTTIAIIPEHVFYLCKLSNQPVINLSYDKHLTIKDLKILKENFGSNVGDIDQYILDVSINQSKYKEYMIDLIKTTLDTLNICERIKKTREDLYKQYKITEIIVDGSLEDLYNIHEFFQYIYRESYVDDTELSSITLNELVQYMNQEKTPIEQLQDMLSLICCFGVEMNRRFTNYKHFGELVNQLKHLLSEAIKKNEEIKIKIIIEFSQFIGKFFSWEMSIKHHNWTLSAHITTEIDQLKQKHILPPITEENIDELYKKHKIIYEPLMKISMGDWMDEFVKYKIQNDKKK